MINMKNKVIFLRSHRTDQEIRTPKEINVLNKLNYDIKLINWDRDNRSIGIKRENKNTFEEIQLKFKAPAGLIVFPFLLVWWTFAFYQLMKTEWDVVHAINLDSIPAAILAAKFKHKKVIYEILDIYEFNMALPIQIRNLFLAIDKFFTNLADAVVVVDEEQIVGMQGIPNKNVHIIYDSPPTQLSDMDNGINNNYFTLFYAGVLFKRRKLNLDKLVDAIKNIEGVKLVIAGYGDLVVDVNKWSKDNPNKIEFLGKISYEEVFKYGKNSDLFFILRDPEILVNKYTCGSTLFNAMLCEKPIIVNKGTSTSKKILKHNCGIVLDADDVEEIKLNIIKLRDNPNLCQELGSNGIDIYTKNYSWDLMEEKIETLYDSLEK